MEGFTTHSPDLLLDATAGGADYVGFGPIFPTASKTDHEAVVGVEGLRHARPLTPLPMFAIGGITVASAEGIMHAGADGIAVMSAVWSATDIATAVKVFIERIARATRPMSG